jgi:hypothetical protein
VGSSLPFPFSLLPGVWYLVHSRVTCPTCPSIILLTKVSKCSMLYLKSER